QLLPVALHAPQILRQRRHTRARVGGSEPAAGVQPGDLRGGEVLHLPRRTVGEDLLRVGGALEVVVVDHHEFAVLGALDVVLHPADAEFGRLVHGGQRVLGSVGGSAPVGDDRRRGAEVVGPGAGRGDQEAGGGQERGGRGGNCARVHAYSSRRAI